ncbi:G-type lectin S-receptor-like serine/threonine-protein kinase SD1-1 [Linum perenne]
MKPKISDFGLAKTFGADQTKANTNRVVGTHSGYMSPEYAVDGIYSVKSNIYSYGVLVLEIISGKRNRGFHHPSHDLNLLGHVSTQTKCITMRYIQVALLCVQQKPEDRPNMSLVVLMLGSADPLPQPKQPGFFTARSPLHKEDTSSSRNDTNSINGVTMTLLEAR